MAERLDVTTDVLPVGAIEAANVDHLVGAFGDEQTIGHREVDPVRWTVWAWVLVMVSDRDDQSKFDGGGQGRKLGFLPALSGRRQAACWVEVVG
jgi:hypothetical protein